MAVAVDVEESLAAKFAALLPHLDERQQRLYLGSEARSLGHGGVAAVARAAGVSRPTVTARVAGLEAGEQPLGRARRGAAGGALRGRARPRPPPRPSPRPLTPGPRRPPRQRRPQRPGPHPAGGPAQGPPRVAFPPPPGAGPPAPADPPAGRPSSPPSPSGCPGSGAARNSRSPGPPVGAAPRPPRAAPRSGRPALAPPPAAPRSGQPAPHTRAAPDAASPNPTMITNRTPAPTRRRSTGGLTGYSRRAIPQVSRPRRIAMRVIDSKLSTNQSPTWLPPGIPTRL